MPVAIDQVDVEVLPPAEPPAPAAANPPPPDPREIQRVQERAEERRARVRAH